MDLDFSLGNQVSYEGKIYKIKQALDLSKILLQELDSGNTVVAKVSKVIPIEAVTEKSEEQEISLIDSKLFAEAKRREDIIKPLVEQLKCSLKQAEQAGKELNLTSRQVYNLINTYRNNGFKLLSLLPENHKKGGLRKNRIDRNLDEVISKIIKKFYLNNQRFKISKIIEEVKLSCFRANIKAPSVCTIRRRVANYDNSRKITMKREGAKKAIEQYSPVVGSFPECEAPLQVYQIDHTKVDLIIVDEIYRQPIGRPFLTIAIDVCTRCIAGFCLTLDPPSSVSVGLCLTHAVLDKEEWMLNKKLDLEWPIWGKPEKLYVDNAKEFYSQALIKGCEVHGIKIEYRPLGKTHYGGIVERVIGTLMQLVHQIPGTTFSNIRERGNYDAEGEAILTLSELERWLAIAITQYYHQKQHAKLLKPPIQHYQEIIIGNDLHTPRGYPKKIYNRKEFLIDFLPIVYRSIQRTGFVIDQINYYDDILSPFIAVTFHDNLL
jgi:putative transposase